MRTLCLTLLAFSTLFISGCGLLGYDADISKIVKDGKPKDCASLKGEDAEKTKNKIDKCYDSYAQKHEMPELCSKIKKESKHDRCYENLAEKREDINLCKKLKSDSSDCISKVGIAKNDESICAELEEGLPKDKCNTEVGKDKKSIEICELISNKRLKDDCLEPIAVEKQDISLCEKLSRYNKEGCLQQIAIDTKDISLCEKLRKKELCIEKVTAITEQDSNTNEGGNDSNDADLENDLEDDDLDEEILEELEDETTKAGVNLVDGKLYINSSPGEVLKITSSDLPGWASSKMVVVGASAVCVGPPSTISSGDSSVLLNGLPIAREGDETSHGGSIVKGSDKIFINGVSAAIVGSQTVCPMTTNNVPHVGGPISNNGY